MPEATLFDVEPLTQHREPNPCIYMFGPGPEGKKCRTCMTLLKCGQGRSRQWYKCRLRSSVKRPGTLGGKETDHRVGWNACALYTEGDDSSGDQKDQGNR